MASALILRSETLTIHPAPGVAKKIVAVTYRLGMWPERTLYIPAEQYNDDEAERIVKEAAFGK